MNNDIIEQLQQKLAICQEKIAKISPEEFPILTSEEKEHYFQMDVVIRIISGRNMEDMKNVLFQKIKIPKDIWKPQVLSNQNESHENMIKYLETKCITPMERIKLSITSETKLINMYNDFKKLEKSTPINVVKIKEFLTSLLSKTKPIQNVEIYDICDIFIYAYLMDGTRTKIYCNKSNSKVIFDTLESFQNAIYRTKLSIRLV